MASVGEYLLTWKLKLSTTKAVLAVFHLNNKEAKRAESQPQKQNLTLSSEPTYLRVTGQDTHVPPTPSYFAKS